MIWDQEGTALIKSEDDLSNVQISFGSTDSLTGCDIVEDPKYWLPATVGFQRKGLLCGNTGTFLAVSVANLNLPAATCECYQSTVIKRIVQNLTV